MDWRTIGTFAAVFAAILTIAFNAFVQWKQLRRERMVVLKKALLNLLEIRQVVEAAYIARLSKDKVSKSLKPDADEIEKVVHYKLLQTFDREVYDSHTTKRKNLQERFQEIVQSIGGEAPFLALQLTSCDSFLHRLDETQQFWQRRQDSKKKIETKNAAEALAVELTSETAPELPSLSSIGSALNSLDKSIKTLSELCGKKTRKACQEYLAKKNATRDKEQEQKKVKIGEGALEQMEARHLFIQKILPKDEYTRGQSV